MAIRIAHITTVDSSLTHLLLNQMRSLQIEGYEVCGVSAPGEGVRQLTEAGIGHIAVPINRRLSPLADLKSLWRLYRVLRREQFSIVHTHTPKAGLLGQLAAKAAGVPIIVNTIHGFYFHDQMRALERRFYIMLEKVAALCSDTILSQNSEDVQTALREGICQPQLIKHLGNGIDVRHFNPANLHAKELPEKRRALNIPEDAFVVGFVGRLAARRKGFLDFLAAAQIISQQYPNARFLIAGDTDHGKPDAVEPEAAKDYGVWDKCVFVGHRALDEMPLLYGSMSVLVLPSLFEGVPRAVMEAAAMKIPVVATNVKGNREAVEHGTNGTLVPLGDVQALASAIMDLLTDREKATRMGEAGRCLALAHFDEQKVFATIKDEYTRLIQAKGLAAPDHLRFAAS